MQPERTAETILRLREMSLARLRANREDKQALDDLVALYVECGHPEAETRRYITVVLLDPLATDEEMRTAYFGMTRAFTNDPEMRRTLIEINERFIKRTRAVRESDRALFTINERFKEILAAYRRAEPVTAEQCAEIDECMRRVLPPVPDLVTTFHQMLRAGVFSTPSA